MSVFRDSLVFFDDIGLFDVVLPFLLIFTLVFGILEKSRIFGTEEVGGKMHPKKNLNAMVAFCTGFFVVASAQLVALINVFVAYTALILVIIIMFMLLVGSFHGQQGDKGLDLSKWVKPFTFVIIVALALIFLHGVGWLGPLWDTVTDALSEGKNSELVGTILLFGVIVGFMWFVTSDRGAKEDKSKS